MPNPYTKHILANVLFKQTEQSFISPQGGKCAPKNHSSSLSHCYLTPRQFFCSRSLLAFRASGGGEYPNRGQEFAPIDSREPVAGQRLGESHLADERWSRYAQFGPVR